MTKNARNNLYIILILLLQILVLNDVHINNFMRFLGIPAFIPLVYPAIILLMPLNQNYYLTMLYAIIVGVVMDISSSTPGMHTMVLVFLAFIRPHLVRLFYQYEEKKPSKIRPNLKGLGLVQFLLYCTTAIVIHHFILFTFQVWSFKNIPNIFFKTIVSSFFSILLILIAQLFFSSKKSV